MRRYGKTFFQRARLIRTGRVLMYARVFLLAVAGVVLAAAARAEAAPFDAVRMAGTFNDWATADDGYRLVEDDGRYVLKRFLGSGRHTFKFVFDGSWARHWGAGKDGRLEQPGRDIPFEVRASGVYEVWLDVGERRWGFAQGWPDAPLPVMDVRAADHRRVVLDGSRSIPSGGAAISTYRWEVVPATSGAAARPLDQDAAAAPVRRVEITRPGDFEIRLSVTDASGTAEAVRRARLGGGWRLRVKGDDGATEVTYLSPVEPGRWATVWRWGDARGMIEPAVAGPSATQGSEPDSTTDVAPPRDPAVRPLLIFEQDSGSVRFDDARWHAFTLDARKWRNDEDLRVERVSVIGDFNGWRPDATPLEVSFDGNRYQRFVLLPEGLYAYKLLINGCIAIEDPQANAALRSPDGHGGYNSGVRIGPDPAAIGPARPGAIIAAGVAHVPDSTAYVTPISDRFARVTVRTLAGDVESIEMLDGEGREMARLLPVESRGGFDYWSAQVSSDRPQLAYVFRLRDGDADRLLSPRGLLPAEGARDVPLFEAELRMTFETPEWAKRVVWYQIFPERFRNADPGNDPPRTVPWTHAWDKPYQPKRPASGDLDGWFEERGTFFQYIYDRRYGGDLRGIREQLPYLRRLGATGIYFNPIFLAESLHKYDASDLRHIDDFFGVRGSVEKLNGEGVDPATWQWSETDRLFLAFLEEAHAMGFKVILDGVFNHTGRAFWAFQDVLEHGAESQFADWFDIKSWEPFHYRAWDRDDGSLPRLKHDEALGLSEPVRQHLFAITRRWMDPDGDGDPSDGIDGWRLDVAADINANFWRDWRKLVKEINPDAYIVAELWEESKAWLDGKTFDAVMNYPFARAAQRFFINNKKASRPSAFDEELRRNLSWYPPQVNYVLQNLFDSHDTDRIASMAMNPDLEYDQANRLQDNGPNYDTSKPTPEAYRRVMLAVTFQMTFLGAPMVYYGDEVGMYGADDPSCRKPMLWSVLMPYDDPNERIEEAVFEHYRRMIAIRNSEPALQLGSFETLQTADRRRMYAYARVLGNDVIVVVLNNSNRRHRVDVPVPWSAQSTVLRLDEPSACAIMDPPADEPEARPTVRPIPGASTKVRIEDGTLKGAMLEPRSGAVFKVIQP